MISFPAVPAVADEVAFAHYLTVSSPPVHPFLFRVAALGDRDPCDWDRAMDTMGYLEKRKFF